MSTGEYVLDADGVAEWDARSARRVREEDRALHADGRVVTPQDVNRWLREAREAQDACEAVLRELMTEHGAGPVVEALHALGVLAEPEWGWS